MADDVPLAFYLQAGLFLKPEARVSVDVKLPEIKSSGTAVSNWEVMEKIKTLTQPEEFVSLRVVNYSRELVQFEGELDSVRAMRKVLLMLNGKSMKLSGFSELLRVRANQLQAPYPTRAEWEEFFETRGTSVFEEGRPGERPDTIRVKGLPVKWFVSKGSEGRPCVKVLSQAFQKFGLVRQVGLLDATAGIVLERREGESFACFGPGTGTRTYHFEAYVQYEKYTGFINAINSLKGMVILRLEEGGKEAVARISVEFDKTAFLSERNIRKRTRAEERRRQERKEEERKEQERKKEEELRKQVWLPSSQNSPRLVLCSPSCCLYTCAPLSSQEEQRLKEEEEARRQAQKHEEKRRKKEQQAAVVAELKAVAVSRREEAQRLLRALLAAAAEER